MTRFNGWKKGLHGMCQGIPKSSKPIEFFALLVTGKLLNKILIQTQLYKTAQAINKSNNQNTALFLLNIIMKLFRITLHMAIFKYVYVLTKLQLS